MALYARSRSVAQVLPFGPCLSKSGSSQHTLCPERLIHSAGRYTGQLELCVCPCHEHKEDEYPEQQRERMARNDQDTSIPTETVDDTEEDAEAPAEGADDETASEQETDEEDETNG